MGLANESDHRSQQVPASNRPIVILPGESRPITDAIRMPCLTILPSPAFSTCDAKAFYMNASFDATFSQRPSGFVPSSSVSSIDANNLLSLVTFPTSAHNIVQTSSSSINPSVRPVHLDYNIRPELTQTSLHFASKGRHLHETQSPTRRVWSVPPRWSVIHARAAR
ncbi:hypothetical protein PoB_007149700 [Plakobranchus ocellatus]|uniref:Uncharacterized protein n=1 Tax=Plakobranchus ocellatus TaxID=259542 RepID=A0AAV4DLS1_9GAST|nr:hypothetical protein PoB_007149700 [Plakobranchus ocellatus]